jgi:hypothetical protein
MTRAHERVDELTVRYLRPIDVQFLGECIELLVRESLSEIAQQVSKRIHFDIVLVSLDEWRHSEGSQDLIRDLLRLHLGVGAIQKVCKLYRVIWLFQSVLLLFLWLVSTSVAIRDWIS